MTLSLCMIVLNEAHCIRATLQSAKPFIDHWVILDTGSTDGTQAIIREVLAGLSGELHEGLFVNFSDARNRVIDLLGTKTTHALWMDGDDVLVNGDSLRFLLTIVQESRFEPFQVWPTGQLMVPRIHKTGLGWRYHGKVHEVLRHPTEQIGCLVGPMFHHFPCAIGDAKSRARLTKDVELLREAVAAEPSDERAAFHLAHTLAMINGTTD